MKHTVCLTNECRLYDLMWRGILLAAEVSVEGVHGGGSAQLVKFSVGKGDLSIK